jgi:hypothetical protein
MASFCYKTAAVRPVLASGETRAPFLLEARARQSQNLNGTLLHLPLPIGSIQTLRTDLSLVLHSRHISSSSPLYGACALRFTRAVGDDGAPVGALDAGLIRHGAPRKPVHKGDLPKRNHAEKQVSNKHQHQRHHLLFTAGGLCRCTCCSPFTTFATGSSTMATASKRSICRKSSALCHWSSSSCCYLQWAPDLKGQSQRAERCAEKPPV